MRDRLLDAVERLLVKGGVDAVRLDAVAAEAGVSKGGLLHHFPSKRALVEGVVQRLVDRFEAVLPGPDAPPGAYTMAWLDRSIPEVAPEPGTAGRDEVPLALIAAAAGPEVLDVLQRHYRAWQERLDADGLPPGVSTLVRMAVDGWWTARLLRLAPPHGAAHVELRRLVTGLIDTGAIGTGRVGTGNADSGPSSADRADPGRSSTDPAGSAGESR